MKNIIVIHLGISVMTGGEGERGREERREDGSTLDNSVLMRVLIIGTLYFSLFTVTSYYYGSLTNFTFCFIATCIYQMTTVLMLQ